MTADLPSRDGSDAVARRIGSVCRWLPPALIWVALGLFCALGQTPQDRSLACLLAAALLVLVVSYAGVDPVIRFRLAVAPVFFLAGAVGARAALGGLARAVRLRSAGAAGGGSDARLHSH
jgi:hypothetical protein